MDETRETPSTLQKTATDMHAAVATLEAHLKDAVNSGEIASVSEIMARIDSWRAGLASLIEQ